MIFVDSRQSSEEKYLTKETVNTIWQILWIDRHWPLLTSSRPAPKAEEDERWKELVGQYNRMIDSEFDTDRIDKLRAELEDKKEALKKTVKYVVCLFDYPL